jgi:hypothetical protein
MLAFENRTTKDNAGVNGICQGLENLVLGADGDYMAGNKYENVVCGLFRHVHAVASWLRHYDANRKVTDSIPDEVIFLNFPNSSSRTRPWGLLTL